jgi:hypothetical protein
MMTDHFPGELPDVNELVDIWGRWHRWLPSRVEDRDLVELRVAAPLGVRLRQLGEDDSLDLRWVTRRGVATVAGQLVGIEDGQLPTWRIKTRSTPTVTQRRRYARAAITLPVQVAPEGEAEELAELDEAVLASTIDIGEGGIHCIANIPDMPVGAPVTVIMELDGTGFHAEGRVLRTRPLHDGFRSMVVTFDQLAPKEADRVRRFVFAADLRSKAGVRA